MYYMNQKQIDAYMNMYVTNTNSTDIPSQMCEYRHSKKH
jgi:hypothetical protein